MPIAFGKPKPKAAQDGQMNFKLPDKISSGRGRIPAGKYVGRCTDIVSEVSKNNNPMWTWAFTITAGPQAGRDFKLWTVLTDDAAWKIVETLKALGLEVEAGDEISMSRKDVIGVGCTMHIKDDKGQDGDGEFSKLNKISAHPKGAGYKAGGGLAAKAVAEEIEEEEGETLGCSLCGETFETGEELEYHMGEDHAEELEEIDEQKEEEEEPAPPPRKPAKKVAPAPARGKAPATLGRGPKKH